MDHVSRAVAASMRPEAPSPIDRTGAIVMFAMGVGLAALATFGVVQFVRDRPAASAWLLSGFLALTALAAVLDARQRRRRLASQAVLSALRCPNCGTFFGDAAAHVAFHPPPPPEACVVDNFGWVSVTCPRCGAISTHHPESGDLRLNSPRKPFPPGLGNARRLDHLLEADVRALVRSGPVRFLVEEDDERRTLRLVPQSEGAAFWAAEVQNHVGDLAGAVPRHFPDNYFFSAEGWTDGGTPIILLSRVRCQNSPAVCAPSPRRGGSKGSHRL